MVTTLVVAVGAGDYKSRAFPPLRGAPVDSARLAALFKHRGLADANIRLLEDENATRANCLNALRSWGSLPIDTDGIDLFFYYAGHGLMVQEPGGAKQAVLLTHDAAAMDPIGTGLGLKDVVDAISGRINPRNCYVFIDACEVRGEDRIQSRQVAHFQALAQQQTFALLAAPGADAYETVDSEGAPFGFFTRALLRALDAQRPLTCGAISERVATDLRGDNLAEPYQLISGSIQHRPMDREFGIPGHDTARATIYDTVIRSRARDSVQAAATLHRHVWLFGPSGRGKSQLVRQIELLEPMVWASVPLSHELTGARFEGLQEVLASQIAQSSPDLFPSGTPPIGGLLECIRMLASAGKLLVVDHVDRLGIDSAIRLATLLAAQSDLRIICVSRSEPPPGLVYFGVEAPLLDLEDVRQFVMQFSMAADANPEQLLVMSGGSPLRLRRILADGDTDVEKWIDSSLSAEERNALVLLRASSGFVDSTGFARVAEIDPATIQQLATRGLLQLSGGAYQIHDSLVAIPSLAPGIEHYAVAVHYWTSVLQATLSNPIASIRLVGMLDVAARDESFWRCADLVANDLVHQRSWDMLDRVSEALQNAPTDIAPVGTILGLVSVFMKAVRYDRAGQLLSMLDPTLLDPSQLLAFRLLDVERAWWWGDYEGALASIVDFELGRETRGRLSRGICNWFLGKWEDAEADFDQVVATADEPRTLGWGEIMLASNHAYRGLKLDESRELFALGASRLGRAGDDVGVAVAWGNLGEVSWKLGNFADSRIQLDRALRYAEGMAGDQIVLEIIRSFIELSWREQGPWSGEVASWVNRAEAIYRPEVFGVTAKMQFFNTLATLHCMKGELVAAEGLIDILEPLTRNNREYDCYTRQNRGLFMVLTGSVVDGIAILESAAAAAVEAGGHLTARQVHATAGLLCRYRSDLDAHAKKALLQFSRPEGSPNE